MQIDVVAQSKHACIPFYSIGTIKNRRERTIKSTERFDVRDVVFSYGPCTGMLCTRHSRDDDVRGLDPSTSHR